MRLCRIALCVVLVVVVASAGFCGRWTQGSARNLAMGMTGMALTDGISPAYFNPANLPWTGLTPASGDQSWACEAAGTVEISGDTDYKSIAVSALDAAGAGKTFGIGGFYSDADRGNTWGFGAGMPINDCFSAGLALVKFEDTCGVIGASYRQPLQTGGSFVAALGVYDPTDVNGDGALWGAGVAYPLCRVAGDEQTPLGVLTADCWDLTDKVSRSFHFGAEWLYSANLALRAGVNDSNLTLGAGWRQDKWSVDLGWADGDHDDSSSVFVGGKIGF
jgi:hypothetical protein